MEHLIKKQYTIPKNKKEQKLWKDTNHLKIPFKKRQKHKPCFIIHH